MEKPKSRLLTDEAYRQIKLLILNQEVVPGQRLVYDDLARRLNMSRTPIINALNRLEEHGLVQSESYRGFVVRPMDATEAWESFGMREAIELYAVEQSLEVMEAADLQRLETRLQEYEAYRPQHLDRRKIFLDAAFHLQICDITRNRILKWHLKLVFQHLNLRAKLENYPVGRLTAVDREHNTLIERIRGRDLLGSVEILKNHIRNDRSYFIASLAHAADTDDYSEIE